MMLAILGIQIVILIVVVLIYKDQANFYEATLEKSFQIGKILEKRIKHLVEYVDKREKRRMYGDLFAFKQKVLDGYYGEEEKVEWKTKPFAKEAEFIEEWKEREWQPYDPKLYEEKD